MYMIRLLATDPQEFVMIIVVVVISIVLHELAHGWMAMRLGDDTPLRTGHMTGNPLVHMGPFSLITLCLCGIAWGQMPIDPSRLRGRRAEALVAAAGPATNLLLMFFTLTALGLIARQVDPGLFQETSSAAHGGPMANLVKLLFLFGTLNLLLCIFNLMPVPPLDGAHIVANFHRGYALFVGDPSKQGLMLMAFFMVFILSRRIFDLSTGLAFDYVAWIAGSAEFSHVL